MNNDFKLPENLIPTGLSDQFKDIDFQKFKDLIPPAQINIPKPDINISGKIPTANIKKPKNANLPEQDINISGEIPSINANLTNESFNLSGEIVGTKISQKSNKSSSGKKLSKSTIPNLEGKIPRANLRGPGFECQKKLFQGLSTELLLKKMIKKIQKKINK